MVIPKRIRRYSSSLLILLGLLVAYITLLAPEQQGYQEPQVYQLINPMLVLGDPVTNIYLADIEDFVKGTSDTIYVLDNDERSVVAFNLEGRLLFQFGREGQGPGEFVDPNSLTYDDGKIYITDRSLLRVSEFSSEGIFQRSFSVKYTPTSIVVYNEIAYIGALSVTTLVLQVSLNDVYNQSSVLNYNHPQLENVELRYRTTFPLMANVEGNLVVCLPNTGQLAIANLGDKDLYFNIKQPHTPLIGNYFLSFQRLVKEDEKSPFPRHSLPSVFLSVSSWPESCILLEIRRGRAQTFNPIGIVINCNTLEEEGIHFISQSQTHSHIKFLGNNQIGWINTSNATVDIFGF